MSDLHEARDPKREPQIDKVGWLFSAVAAAIIAVAAVIAYGVSDTTRLANPPLSQIVAR
jgi:hypothetical protein